MPESLPRLLAPDPPRRRRQRRDPRPHFKPDRSGERDPIWGCPEEQVPAGHLSRQVRDWVRTLDLRAVEAQYSSLGRQAYAPANVLAVWIYASLLNLHHASDVAARMTTDVAFRLLSGGYCYSATRLCAFRRSNRTLFTSLNAQVLAMAWDHHLLAPDQCAIDSMRLRAHASLASMRTKERSTQRLRQLDAIDPATLPSDADRERWAEKVTKHRAALARCEETGRLSLSVTNPHATFLKFPSGGMLPGHRLSTVACGSTHRFIVCLLVDQTPTDFGLLGPTATAAQAALQAAGMPDTTTLQMAGDGGYFSETDLLFAEHNADWLDALLKEPAPSKERSPYYGREAFTEAAGVMVCPAGKRMHRVGKPKEGREQWRGVGCGSCPLKAKCTPGKLRTLGRSPAREKALAAMQKRMSQPDAAARYAKRLGTVEPVFSYLEDTMGFRRSSSRAEACIQAEIQLKVLSYNLSRLARGKRLSCVWRWVDVHKEAITWHDAWGVAEVSLPYFA